MWKRICACLVVSSAAAAAAAAALLSGCNRPASPPAVSTGYSGAATNPARDAEAAPVAPAPPRVAHKMGSVRYLALGDSYTCAQSVDPELAYPVQLADLLRARGVDIADPQIVARTGWTTDELSRGIDDANPVGPFDLVTLLIGVNNQYRRRSADEYRGQFVELLHRAIALAGNRPSRVIVFSIPDWGAMPYGRGADSAQIGREIDAFNAINREEAGKAGAAYVDVTPTSRVDGTKGEMMAYDGLHPSGKQYAQWAELAAPVAMRAVGGSQGEPSRQH